MSAFRMKASDLYMVGIQWVGQTEEVELDY